MKKRLLSTLLALCMVLSLLPGTVWAAEGAEDESASHDAVETQPDDLPVSSEENAEDESDSTPVTNDETENSEIMPLADTLTYGHLSYVVTDGTITITGCDESATSVDIPAQIDGVPVTSIGFGAFFARSGLVRVTLPNGVTDIGGQAFKMCSSLTSINIPDSVTNIGGWAFQDCSGLTSAGPIGGGYSYEFGWKNYIPSYAFSGCSGLASVAIPGSIANIGDHAFVDCSALTDITLPNGISSIRGSTFAGCSGLTSIVIPESVMSIGEYAFFGCRELVSITIPNSVTVIEEWAFTGCSGLESISIPEGISCIEQGVFSDCSGLSSVTLPNSVMTIGESAFERCGALAGITIPSSVTDIRAYAFFRCGGLTNVYYDGSRSDWEAIIINNDNDHNKPLFDATIHYNSTGPSDVNRQTISGILRSGEGWSIRWECTYSLDANGSPQNGRVEITASESNVREELYLYNDASADGFPWELAPYNIPKSAITSLSIQGSITKKLRIAANSFTGYDNLRTVALNGVSGIDSNAFYGCSKLEQIALMSPDETLARIGDGAFKNCTSLSKIEFPGALTNIGAETFRNTALGDITLWKNLEEIGENAFADCPNLKISCYENSVAHRYAVENGIPFQLIDENPYQVDIPWGGEVPESFVHNLDYLISHTSSKIYSPELAHMLITLCNSVHNDGIMSEAMTALGFQNNRYLLEFITFNIGRKQLSDGTTLVLIVVRGTVDGEEWVSNFDAFLNASLLHKGFADAADEIYQRLVSDVLKTGESLTNVKFVITGHSRGAAAANLLEYKLHGMGVAQENLYGYNFACPDVATRYSDEWNPTGKYDNMFNLGNASDPVPLVPGVIGTGITVHLPGASWGKFGQSLWFSKNWDSLDENGGTLHFSAHFQDKYLEILRRQPPITSFKTWRDVKTNVFATQVGTIGKFFGFCCPVDVVIKDKAGNPVASVINGVGNYYSAEFGKIMIFTDEDKKSIFVQGNEPLTVYLTATDSGTMEYTVRTVDWSQDAVLSEKVFSAVSLVSGKKMASMTDVENVTGVGIDVSKVPLYVLGEDGQPELKVLPDDKGTEVPLDAPDAIYTISFDTTVVSLEVSPMKTQPNGKLSSLPKLTRNGYTFDGWFTATSGGSQITTETVFDRNTTVYAHWTYVGGGTTTNPGNPSYYPDSGYWDNYTPPTYAITVPSPANGVITVSPKFAAKGSTVTITVVPDTGYQLALLTVLDSNGKAITLTDKGNGKYTFTMPSGKVTVDATFQPIQIPETPWNNPFTDVAEGEWYYEAVRFVQENGLMGGYGNGTFAPNANLSRAMLAQILYNKEGQPTVAGSAFTDVQEGAWYAGAVTWAAEQGVVGGYGNGLFGPDDNITREQLAVMLWRYSGEPAATDKELHFSDADTVSGYALDALCWAVENGIINGKGGGILDPKGFATRAEVAQMLMNYLKK